jgi:chromosome segregation protein
MRSDLETGKARREQLRQRLSILESEIVALEDERHAILQSIENSRARMRVATGEREASLQAQSGLQRDRGTLLERLTEARDRAERDREQVKEIAIMVESRRSSKQSASAALERVHAQRRYLSERNEELLRHVRELEEPLAAERATLESQLADRLKVESELTAARAAVEASEQQVRGAEEQRVGAQRGISEARDAAEAARMTVREIEVRADTVREQFNKSGLDAETVAAELPVEATLADWSETLDSIERKIQRLGAINLAAIDEFEEKSARKEYLDKQYEDLTEALTTLEAAIKKIDGETRTRFRETFDRANQGLGELFPRLFGGGHAYLELESDDLLSAGVTVMARPPGKRISTIHLMSGGEKALTAVALVFAIFKLNPAPFCLLDEVDAPLDDANVGRFSEIVREMSDQVQFVLITHNKTTMEAMSQLAGVTMHEPGVSRLVAVDIDEAVQLAAM